MIHRLVSLALLSATLAAQISFTHSNRGQVQVTGYSPQTGSTSQALPAGPFALPVNLVTAPRTTGTLAITTATTSTLATIRTQASAISYDLNGTASATCDVRTVVTSPRPARVRLTLVPNLNSGPGTGVVLARVDVGGDGSVEFCSGTGFACFGAGTATSFDLLVDSQGVTIDWRVSCSAAGTRLGGSPISSSAALDMNFTVPLHEAGYGTPCGGELGVTRTPASAFGRTFVGTVPSTAILAWIVLGNQPTNLTFPQIPCPLICDPDIVGSVRLGPAAGGRRVFEFQDQMPPLPGASWFTQAFGLDNGTFFGTNGVNIRT